MEQQTQSQTKTRDTNIELLRILAMFMVVVIHCICYTGATTNEITSNWFASNILLSIAGVADVLFLLITGYYAMKSKLNIKKIALLWGKTIFYSYIIFAIYTLVFHRRMNFYNIYSSIFPVLSGNYWFITAYIALYLLTPIIKIIVQKLTQNQFKYLLILLGIYYGIVSFIFEPSVIFKGHFPRVIFIYLIGAYIGMYVKEKKDHYFAKYLLMCAVRTLVFVFVNVLLKIKPNVINNNMAYNIDDLLNIIFILGGIFLFMGFRTIKINNKTLQKVITCVSASTFPVYIIHESNLNRNIWTITLNKIPNHWNLGVLMTYSIMAPVTVFVLCILIDLIRRLIVYLIRKIPQIDSIFTKTAKKVDNINERINKFIEPKEERVLEEKV